MKIQNLSKNSTISDHRNLKVWMVAVELVTCIFHFTKKLPTEEKFGLCSQVRNASVSVAGNIAEGAAKVVEKNLSGFCI